MPKVGDYVVYCGHLYVVAFTITFNDGRECLALRQNQWRAEWHLVVAVKDALIDPPPSC